MQETLDNILGLAVGILFMVVAATVTLTLTFYAQNPIAQDNNDKAFIEATGKQATSEEKLTLESVIGALYNSNKTRSEITHLKFNDGRLWDVGDRFKANLDDNITYIISAENIATALDKEVTLNIEKDSSGVIFYHYIYY